MQAVAQVTGYRRVAQRESAAFTRPRPQVRALPRLPPFRGLLRVPEIRSISAVTFATLDMARAVRFYAALGFSMAYGGETGAFTSFRVGTGHLNLARVDDQPPPSGGTRVIFYVDDVDAHFARAKAAGATILSPVEQGGEGKRYRAEDLEGHRWMFMQR